MYGGNEQCIQKFGRKTSREETMSDLGVDVRIILKLILD
jgi:hypothetical protein